MSIRRIVPAVRAAPITPSDSVEYELADALYVGAAGDATVLMEDGATVTLVGLAAGTVYPIRTRRVNATGLTAASLVALYSRDAIA